MENPKSGKARGFCFTVNNYSGQDIDWLAKLGQEPSTQYLIAGLEEAPSTGTPHIQGYIYFKNPRSIDKIWEEVPGHVIRANGSPYDNFVYCSKGGIFKEWGTRPEKQGKRTDLDIVKGMIAGRASISEIWLEVSSYQALRFAEKGLELFAEKRTMSPLVEWLWGPTGTGKTEHAFAMCAKYGQEPWVSGSTRGEFYFNGYKGEKWIILDDFRGGDLPFNTMLRLLDRYPMTVNVKGGIQSMVADHIYITSSKPPEKCFTMTKEDMAQLMRRIHCVYQYDEDGERTRTHLIWPKDVQEIMERDLETYRKEKMEVELEQRSGGNSMPPPEPQEQ